MWEEERLVSVVETVERAEEGDRYCGEVHDEVVNCLRDGEGEGWWVRGGGWVSAGTRFGREGDGVF